MSIDALRALIVRRLGLLPGDTELESILRARVKDGDVDGYLARLAAEDPEMHEVARTLTVPETYFFRDPDQLRAFTDVALPARMRAARQNKHLRVLSAGCASGEEPFSLAMLANAVVQHHGFTLEICAIDINSDALARAKRGVYSHWSLRQTSHEARHKWFVAAGAREVALDPHIRTLVHFEHRNLAEDNADLLAEGAWDVVFCRNMLMYFDPEVAAQVIARFTRALAPGGYLFLGHAESLRATTHALLLCQTHETFYYQRSDSTVAASLADEPVGWYETITLASERVQTLHRGMSTLAVRGDEEAPVLALIGGERYAEAHALIERMPAEHRPLLMMATVHAHLDQRDAGRALCEAIVRQEPDNADARYVWALCEESPAGALGRHREAAALDPTFAMPRMQAGLLERRLGDTRNADEDLDAASRLMANESDRRITLFGGGFGRNALVTMCQAELSALRCTA